VHGHDRVPGGHQTVDDQPAGALDDDRQSSGISVAGQAVQRRRQVLLGMRNAQRSTTAPASSSTVTSWVVLAQSQPTNIWPPSGVAA
jgi:hypothetical protein